MSSVVVADATKAFGHRVLFERLAFEIAPRRLTALTGPSGSGKSALLNCLGLLDDLTRGSIVVDGVNIARLAPRLKRRFRRDQLGYLFQNYALIENASVRENLEVALRGRTAPRSACDDALERVGLAGRGGEPVFQLSGGEQQRVALARLLVKRPTVILADEPTGALDDANADMVIDTLRTLSSTAAVVIATHSHRVVEACDDAIRLDALVGSRG